MKTAKVSIVVPAFNESTIIIATVDEVADWAAQNLDGAPFEIIVVDDGSSDGMGDVLESARDERPWLVVARHSRNFGRGRACRTGFAASDGDYVVCLDADLSYAPYHIASLLEPLIAGAADITLASPYHPEGRVSNVPTQRAWISKWGNWMLGLGLGGRFRTLTCIVRGYRREVVQTLELINDGKDLHLEIIQKAMLLGYRITEVPARLHWRDRKRDMLRDSKAKKRGWFVDFPLFSMRKMVVSHLIFNYITNPGILLFVPVSLLALTTLVTGFLLTSALVQNIAGALGSEAAFSLYDTLRETLLDGQLTFTVFLFSIVILMMFLVLFFLSFQSKRAFDETYVMLCRMNARLKSLEEGTGD